MITGTISINQDLFLPDGFPLIDGSIVTSSITDSLNLNEL